MSSKREIVILNWLNYASWGYWGGSGFWKVMFDKIKSNTFSVFWFFIDSIRMKLIASSEKNDEILIFQYALHGWKSFQKTSEMRDSNSWETNWSGCKINWLQWKAHAIVTWIYCLICLCARESHIIFWIANWQYAAKCRKCCSENSKHFQLDEFMSFKWRQKYVFWEMLFWHDTWFSFYCLHRMQSMARSLNPWKSKWNAGWSMRYIFNNFELFCACLRALRVRKMCIWKEHFGILQQKWFNWTHVCTNAPQKRQMSLFLILYVFVFKQRNRIAC